MSAGAVTSRLNRTARRRHKQNLNPCPGFCPCYRIGALEHSGGIAGRNSRALQLPSSSRTRLARCRRLVARCIASSAHTPRMVAPPMRVPCQPATEGLLDRPGYPGQRSLLENHRPQARDDRRSGRAAMMWATRRGRAAAWSSAPSNLSKYEPTFSRAVVRPRMRISSSDRDTASDTISRTSCPTVRSVSASASVRPSRLGGHHSRQRNASGATTRRPSGAGHRKLASSETAMGSEARQTADRDQSRTGGRTISRRSIGPTC